MPSRRWSVRSAAAPARSPRASGRVVAVTMSVPSGVGRTRGRREVHALSSRERGGNAVGHSVARSPRRRATCGFRREASTSRSRPRSRDVRGSGVGRALMAHAMRWAHESGYRAMTIDWSCRESPRDRFFTARGIPADLLSPLPARAMRRVPLSGRLAARGRHRRATTRSVAACSSTRRLQSPTSAQRCRRLRLPLARPAARGNRVPWCARDDRRRSHRPFLFRASSAIHDMPRSPPAVAEPERLGNSDGCCRILLVAGGPRGGQEAIG